MKKFVALIVFSALLLVPAGSFNAFAMMGEISGNDVVPRQDLNSVYTKETSMGMVEFSPTVVVSDNPALHLVAAGGFPDGVAFLEIARADIPQGFVVLCTGALLEETRQHILTAAHCVSDPLTGAQNLVDGTQATFEGDAGTVTIQVIEDWSFVHPNWLGENNILCGDDIAILELEEEAPAEITGYVPDSNPGDDVFTSQAGSFTKYGYGTTGVGIQQFNDMMKRDGLNNFDALGDVLQNAAGLCNPNDFAAGGILQYDFDNGLVANDAFNAALGFPIDTGFGEDEINGAPGDSGGPDMTNNEITGIASYGLTFVGPGVTWDTSPGVDFSWGEFSGSTRVSSYVNWIDQVLQDSMDEKKTVVGGELLPIETTSLLLAGAQMNAVWMIPLIVAAAAIGIVVTRKF